MFFTRIPKHIKIDWHFVLDKIQVSFINTFHVPLKTQLADCFIKDLGYPLISYCCPSWALLTFMLRLEGGVLERTH